MVRHPVTYSHPITRFSSFLSSGFFTLDHARSFFVSGAPTHAIGGLTNIGSNCYINSVLQILAYTPGFGEFCLSLPNVLYQSNSSDALFLDSFAHIFSEMQTKRAPCPSWFLHDSALLSDRFRFPFQEDAHEYLAKLLCRFDLECRNAMGSDSEDDPTFISRYFRWEITSEFACEHCQHRWISHKKLLEISVPVRNGAIEKTIAQLTSGNPIRYQGKCENCHSRNSVLERNHPVEFPLIVTVILMRFDRDLHKIDRYVTFPDRLEIGHQTYELYGLIEHEGKVINHGHFIAYVRDETGAWHKADDTCVYRAKREAVMSSHPYLLFYKRVI
jgi:ubiquitin C-terminal hydrolase